jgi:hypothetical protein
MEARAVGTRKRDSINVFRLVEQGRGLLDHNVWLTPSFLRLNLVFPFNCVTLVA